VPELAVSGARLHRSRRTPPDLPHSSAPRISNASTRSVAGAGTIHGAAGSQRLGLGALIIGILAVATIVVFWLGLPTILGAAAIALGLGARERGAETGKATAGLVLGTLAIVAHVVLAFVG
jgi:hypothetical protein